MSGQSPAVVLYSSDGIELSVVRNATIPTNTRAILIDGTDIGGTARTLLTDSSGQLYVNQGSPNTLINAWPVELTDGYGHLFGEANNPIYVTGTVTASNPSVGSDGAAYLSYDTQVGGRVTTAAPTYTNGNLNALSLTTLGGLRIDGVYAAGTANATAADLMASGGYVTTASPTYTTGQLEALSLTTAGALRVDGSAVTQPVSGTVTANQGTPNTLINAWPVELTDGYGHLFGEANNPIYVTGTVTANNQSVGTDGSTALTYDTQVGAKVITTVPTYSAGNLQALTMDVGGNLRVVTNKASTSAITTVSATTASQTLLAANNNRVFASVYNGGSRNAYIVLSSSAASTSNYSIVLLTGSYWEIPVDYIGQVNIIWSTSGASALTGSALVTELTP